MPKKTSIENFWLKVNKTNNCWFWIASKDKPGYGQLVYNKKHYTTHRFSYEIHYGPIPNGLCVCHNCDTPCCVRPDHLFLGTHKDNILDKISKLIERQIKEIRSSNLSKKELAKQYNVSIEIIRRIINRKTWKHI